MDNFHFFEGSALFSSLGPIPTPHQFISSALAFGMASSSDLLVIFKDLTANCEKVREVCRKSKWKFKMAFAMKGGGLDGVSSATYLF